MKWEPTKQYTPQQLQAMQQDALERVRQMQRRSEQVVRRSPRAPSFFVQEGVSAEAAAFAGRHKLDNLILLYDSNDVTLGVSAEKTSAVPLDAPDSSSLRSAASSFCSRSAARFCAVTPNRIAADTAIKKTADTHKKISIKVPTVVLPSFPAVL